MLLGLIIHLWYGDAILSRYVQLIEARGVKALVEINLARINERWRKS